ncbi:MAG: peptidoglycan-binding domain-containing protein [Pseudomonadota bacterium]
MRTGVSDEWTTIFCGTAMISVLITVFLLDDPTWKAAAIDTVLDGEHEEWPVDGTMISLEPSAVPATRFAEAGEPVWQAPAVLAERPFIDSSVELAGISPLPARALTVTPSTLALSSVPVQDLNPILPSTEMLVELETQLGLTVGQRAVVQRRLTLAGFDPLGVDGIFGEGTRAAISEMQQDEGLPETGFLDAASLLALTSRTEKPYQAWRAAKAKARRAAQIASAVEVPPQRPSAGPERKGRCARDSEGRIIGYQGFLCDLSGLGENLLKLRPGPVDEDGPRLADARPQRDR